MTVERMTLLMVAAGFPLRVIPWSIAQSQLESANFNDAKAIRLNNYSFIAYSTTVNKATGNKNQKYSKPDPNGSQHAYFTNALAWVIDFKRVLSMGANPPINAPTVEEFGNRLLLNGYTDTDLNTYVNNIIQKAKKINIYPTLLTALTASLSLAAYIVYLSYSKYK